MRITTGIMCLCMLVLQAQGCTKFNKWWWRNRLMNESEDQKAYFSEYVAYGEVLGEVVGNHPYSGVAGVRIVKFKVKCSFKGAQMPEDIIIAGVGNLNGEIAECPKADLKEHDMAVVYLKKISRPNVFEIEYSPLLPTEDIDPVDELTIICGLNLLFPKGQGIEQQDTYSCYPGMTKEDGCLEYDPTPPLTPRPATSPTTTTTNPPTTPTTASKTTPTTASKTTPTTTTTTTPSTTTTTTTHTKTTKVNPTTTTTTTTTITTTTTTTPCDNPL